MKSAMLKRNCIEAADFLAEQAPHSVEPELARACSEVLFDMAERVSAYENTIQIADFFLKEFHTAISRLEKIKNATKNALHDWTFELFETLAILAREDVLRNHSARPAQAEAIRYFMESGHWMPDDPTLVSEYYYHKIPALLAGEGQDATGVKRRPHEDAKQAAYEV